VAKDKSLILLLIDGSVLTVITFLSFMAGIRINDYIFRNFLNYVDPYAGPTATYVSSMYFLSSILLGIFACTYLHKFSKTKNIMLYLYVFLCVLVIIFIEDTIYNNGSIPLYSYFYYYKVLPIVFSAWIIYLFCFFKKGDKTI